MRIIQFISRFIVGLVFIFSGFVKAVDPMGSAFKFSDYFTAFGMDLFKGIAFPLAIILSSLEFTIGIALVFNCRKQLTAWMALLFMLFFTTLTLLLAIYNPVTDCGCFGDALVLTNWATFWKNIILLIFAIFTFLLRRLPEKKPVIWEQNLLIGFGIFISVWISVYSYRHLPIIDFRPYHIGANINDGMKIPEGAAPDQYRSILKYEKDGVVKEFDESNYPWQDTSWRFVDNEQIKIKDGYTPPIHDFTISNEEEGDITDQILSDEGYTFLLVAKNISEINESSLQKIKNLAIYSLQSNFKFIGLTASGREDIEEFISSYEMPFTFYNTDEIQLKTIIRSNPGLILLQKGTILDKWHFNDFPESSQIKDELSSYSISRHQKINIKLVIISITSTLLLLLSLFRIARFRFSGAKNRLRL